MPIGLTGSDFFPLRAQQLYNPANISGDNTGTMNIDERMAQLYQPQTQLSEMYKQLLMNPPAMQPPGKLRTIGALLTGLGTGAGPSSYQHGSAVGFHGDPLKAMQATDLALNQPNYRAMDQYNQQVKSLGLGAGQEEKENVNKRIVAEQTIQKQINAEKQAEIERANQAKEQLTQQLRDRQQMDADTRAANSKINDYKAKNPHSIIKDANGKLVAINPITNETTDLGIETGKLGDEAKLNIQLHNQLAEIEARIKGQKEIVGERGEQTRQNIGVRGEEARKTKAIPSGTPANVATPTKVIRTTKDATGKVTSTVETVKQTGSEQGPKKGERKTFPNGNVGEWDGQHWVLVSKVK